MSVESWSGGSMEFAIGVEWKSRWVFYTRLRDGSSVWFGKVYDMHYTSMKRGVILNTISEADYVMHELAGTLKTEIILTSGTTTYD